MGCSNTRDGRCEEEMKLYRYEGDIRFQNFGVLQGHYAITRFSKGSYMNDYGFTQMAEICNIRITNTRKNPCIEGFFNTFRQEDGTFNAHDLKVLNVLLSTGVAIEKAPVLFEIFDETFSGELSHSELEALVREILHMSTVRVIQLVPDSERPKVIAYLKELVEVENEALLKIVMIAGGDEQKVSRQQFIDNLCRGEGSRLLSSTGVRKLLDDLRVKSTPKLE